MTVRPHIRLLLSALGSLLVLAGSFPGVTAAATPAWKLLAATAPTNLPPRQSEVQRLIVEADGGTFTLTAHEKGEGTPVVAEARLALTEGSQVAQIESVTGEGTVEPGDRIAPPEQYGATRIVSCSTDCRTPGSTVELSSPASSTETGAVRDIFTRELTGVTGTFFVGEKIEGRKYNFDDLEHGTEITAVGPETLTLSKPTSEYITEEGALELVSAAPTNPILFDAPASEVAGALENLPRFGPGSLTVEGGPGGQAKDPYSIEFDGTGTAERGIDPLEVDPSSLTPPSADAHVSVTVPGGPGTGDLIVAPTDVGGAATHGVVTLTIGPLPSGIEATAAAEGEGWTCPETSGEASITCTTTARTPGLFLARPVFVPVEVTSPQASTSSVSVAISGGGAAEAAEYQLPVEVSATPAQFAARAFWAGGFDADGNPVIQAGAHPFSAQTYFLLNSVRSKAGQIIPAGVLRRAMVDLPPGFSGDPLVIDPRCPQNQLEGQKPVAGEAEPFALCTQAMNVGVFDPLTATTQSPAEYLGPLTPFGIYDDVPAKGTAAEFTTNIAVTSQSLLGSVRSSEDFGISIDAPNVANLYKLFGSYAALEGEPAGAHGQAFLTAPTDCAEEAASQPTVGLRTEAYELAGVFTQETTQIPAVTGCEKLQFHPSLSVTPSTTQGSSPTGATAHLHLPQEGLTNPTELAPPDLKDAVVTLPEGMTVNPSSADGLGTCSEAQMGYGGPGPMPNPTRFNENPVSCPESSKIGTASVKTPLLEEELQGTIYLAAQEENPFHSLLAVYLVVESGRFGITLKLPGKVEPDPQTGRLTATFDDNPQLPFEDLTLTFRGGGARSTLTTPEVCGTYKTTGSLEPWSAPESGPAAQIEEGGFQVGSGCASSAQTRPFGPSFEAGTVGTQAGAYSPLVVKVSRNDGEQELRNLNFTLPEGLLGRLAGIPYCPESAIHQAEGVSGKAEQASASCPAASRIGSVDAAAGVGTEPIHVGGNVYLAGPYKGAPLSAVVITPAVAGPFDLGDVVIRAALHVDPETSRITTESDPIPTILKGIPLKLRSVAIDLDRPGFTIDPTDCEPMTSTATIVGSSGATAKPADRFQVTGCEELGFKPHLKVSLKGGTGRTAHPALKAVLTYPKSGAYSNIARAQVGLPHSEFLDQGNLNRTCTKPVLLEGKCPGNTIYGRARAWTPLLEKPLEGPIYLVGGYGYKLPALVAELNGQIRILLKGRVDTDSRKGIRNTFEAVPDAPVSRFVLELKGGKKYGLLENSEDLCTKPQRLAARFVAQNGRIEQLHSVINSQCARGKREHRHKS